MFILLHCWYDGDENLNQDGFIAISESKETLKDMVPEGSQMLIHQEFPDNGSSRDGIKRFRIIEVGPI